MGCQVEYGDDATTVTGRRLKGIDAIMEDISDTVQSLAAVALFAAGPTTIRGVAHIRHKETDRIGNLATELRKLGAAVEELPDGLRITPGRLRPATIDTYNDHRMAMSLALVGLRQDGVVIRNPGCVAKTYPRFFEDLAAVTGQQGASDESVKRAKSVRSANADKTAKRAKSVKPAGAVSPAKAANAPRQSGRPRGRRSR
jgi:3-phosphoshikimate 1-carboxyvinyltransferase